MEVEAKLHETVPCEEYESEPGRSSKCPIDIHPGDHLMQETPMQKFAVYPDHLLRAAALETVYMDSSTYMTISKLEWSMRCAPTICPRMKASISSSLPILAIPTTNSEQPQYSPDLQLPQRPHLRINHAHCYTTYIALAIPISGALQCM
ncbi:hypothetical protein TNCV_2940661 [Trichonephila clavipes]|nr:hypothetical protein TNCV_2940661 [Trichonephila clavipes]